MMYDCGVLLNEDGQFGRPDYRDHNSPLSLHSFYMIEWTTFGALCMALLTNPDAEKEIHGVCVFLGLGGQGQVSSRQDGDLCTVPSVGALPSGYCHSAGL